VRADSSEAAGQLQVRPPPPEAFDSALRTRAARAVSVILANSHTVLASRTGWIYDRPLPLARLLLEIAMDESARKADRIAAIRELLDRGWGKAPVFASIEGADPLEQDEVSEAISGLVEQLRAERSAS
jgi:hypothetical protein